MSKQDLKNELHKIIDDTENEQVSNMFDTSETQLTTHSKKLHEPTLLLPGCF